MVFKAFDQLHRGAVKTVLWMGHICVGYSGSMEENLCQAKTNTHCNP